MLETLLDVLFPAVCVSCAESGEWWCGGCRSRSEMLAVDSLLDDLTGFCAVGYYHDPILRSAIHALKYRGARCLLPAMRMQLERWLARRLSEVAWKHETSLGVQFLPSTPSRVRERGFDQAQLIAALVRELAAPQAGSMDVLGRNEGITHQASLEHGALRAANVAEAFYLKGDGGLPSAIVLVDDVVTTGATMREAARLFRLAGVERVYGFALALGN